MRYDRNGFPIPPDFGVPYAGVPDAGSPDEAMPRRGVGSRKRLVVLAMVAVGLAVVVVPEMMPTVRQMVVEWSLERAGACEARNDLGGAIADMSRAIRWHGDDVDLLCMRAMLRLEDRDATGALMDATHAAEIAPTAVQPLRVRALVHAVLGQGDEAIADAEMVVALAAPGDSETLNHRAYIRAIVGRELPAALRDIDAAIGSLGKSSPELLDTRGFLLHLLGRHQEAIDQLNLAIDGMQQQRRQLGLLAGRMDRSELTRRLRVLDHGLAVMLQHRAMACQEAGLAEQSKQDFELARKKGFDPSRGIF